MSTATDKPVTVRVLVDRALSLPDGKGGSVHHVAGDELELDADEAAQLAADGYVEPAKQRTK